MDLTSLDGKVNFYRPSNKVLDFSIDFSEITSNEFIVPTEKLVLGRWNINITWQQQDEEFLFKKEINY
jgi:nitrogen fixation protein FixH